MDKTDTNKSIVIKYTKSSSDVSDLKLGSKGSAGLDIHANESGVVPCGTTKLIGTGLKFELPEGTFMSICPRSSLGLKTHATIPNSPGILDSDYRGELGLIVRQGYPLDFFSSLLPLIGILTLVCLVIFTNIETITSYFLAQWFIEILVLVIYVSTLSLLVPFYAKTYGFRYNKGDRIAQVIIENHFLPEFVLVDDLSVTTRGSGGFGSTGKS